MNKFNMIVAADDEWCIGKNGQLLAHIPEDMKFFRETTKGATVIMGENTQESLPNGLYLKGRINIVLTNKLNINKEIYFFEDDSIVYYVSNIDEIFEFINEINDAANNNDNSYNNRYIKDKDVFVIGGGQTYRSFLEKNLIETVYLTRIYNTFNGDTFIPDIFELGYKRDVIVTPLTKSTSNYCYSICICRKRP